MLESETVKRRNPVIWHPQKDEQDTMINIQRPKKLQVIKYMTAEMANSVEIFKDKVEEFSQKVR